MTAQALIDSGDGREHRDLQPAVRRRENRAGDRVPGIAFLSGGQAWAVASARLNAMNRRSRASVPWALGFSFGRAIQQPALELWHGEDANVTAAQHALRHRARRDQIARRGEYSAAAERTAA